MNQRQPDGKGRDLAFHRIGVDCPAVFGDDGLGDGKAQSLPALPAAGCIEALKESSFFSERVIFPSEGVKSEAL